MIEQRDDDPGWRFTWSSLLVLVVPMVAMRRASRSDGRDGLIMLRSLFMTFCGALVLIASVVVLLGDLTDGQARPAVSIPVVIAFGAAALIAQRVTPSELDCTTDATLAATYRTRFFLRIAFSESAALVGFAIEISLGPWWVYFVGLGFALVGFWMLAPTRANLAHDQDRLSLGGCRRSLTAALRAAVPPAGSN